MMPNHLNLTKLNKIKLAERGGFEPPIRLRTINLTIS
jgi:hypothetical protein